MKKLTLSELTESCNEKMFSDKQLNGFLIYEHNGNALSNIYYQTENKEQETTYRNRLHNQINTKFKRGKKSFVIDLHPLLNNKQYLGRISFILEKFKHVGILFKIEHGFNYKSLNKDNIFEMTENLRVFTELVDTMAIHKKLIFTDYIRLFNAYKSDNGYKHLNKYIIFEKYTNFINNVFFTAYKNLYKNQDLT